MAKYRRDLTKLDYKILKMDYENHYDSKTTGVFTKDKRRHLLGIKGSGKEDKIKSESDWWYDVRSSVKSGVVDLKLVSDVASVKEQKQMFEISDERFSIADVLHSILTINVKPTEKSSQETTKIGHTTPKDDETAWKSFLAYNLVKIGIGFFLDNFHVELDYQKRNLGDTLDILKSGIFQFEDKLPHDKKYYLRNNYG